MKTETEGECTFFAGRNDNKAAMVIQRIGFCCHGLDGNAHTVRRSIYLNGVILFDSGLLPNVQGVSVTFQQNVGIINKVRTNGLQLGDVFF